jgi:hypothetical protein
VKQSPADGNALRSYPTNWIKNLFAGLDRTEAASARAGQAMEDIASLLEQARDALRQRLQDGAEPAPAALDRAEKEPARNGRRRIANA